MNVIGFDPAKISVIINKQEKSSELSVSDYQSVIKHDIDFILPNEVQNMRHSVLESKCIIDLDKKSKYSVAISDWVTKFLNIESEGEKSSIWQILKRK
jgi:MinD-like ATPase involved in chromosome partitioning or flagellar assembly